MSSHSLIKEILLAIKSVSWIFLPFSIQQPHPNHNNTTILQILAKKFPRKSPPEFLLQVIDSSHHIPYNIWQQASASIFLLIKKFHSNPSIPFINPCLSLKLDPLPLFLFLNTNFLPINFLSPGTNNVVI